MENIIESSKALLLATTAVSRTGVNAATEFDAALAAIAATPAANIDQLEESGMSFRRSNGGITRAAETSRWPQRVCH